MKEERVKKWSRRSAVFAAVLTVALGMGVAFAVWTVGGSGSGTATAISAQPLTTSVATTTAELYPGITGANLYLVVNNPNPFPVTISSVNANGAAVPDGSHAACVTTGVTYTTTAVTQVVPAAGNATFTVPGVSMDNTSDDGCQGATFTIPVTFTATS